MKKLFSVFFLVLLMISHPVGASEKINVLCSTSHLSSMVNELIGNQSNITLIIPFGMCPGHFDLSPGEIKEIQNADIIFYHGYERFIQDIVSIKQNFQKIPAIGNLMIPRDHIRATQKVAVILRTQYPHLKKMIISNLEKYIQRIKKKESFIQENIQGFSGMPVLCSQMNEDFIRWLGANPISVYERDENISPTVLHQLIRLGKKHHVELIIDNLQSGGKIGETISRELNKPLIKLTNFPDNHDYLETLHEIMLKIQAALQRG